MIGSKFETNLYEAFDDLRQVSHDACTSIQRVLARIQQLEDDFDEWQASQKTTEDRERGHGTIQATETAVPDED